MTGCSKLYMELDFLCRNFLNSEAKTGDMSSGTSKQPGDRRLGRRHRTVVDHLQVERLAFVDVIQVFHGNDEAQLQDGQSWRLSPR